jgi:hypothetical protein
LGTALVLGEQHDLAAASKVDDLDRFEAQEGCGMEVVPPQQQKRSENACSHAMQARWEGVKDGV